EHLVDDAGALGSDATSPDLALEQGEVRLAVAIEGDDLAVEDRVRRPEPRRRRQERAEVAGRVLAAAGPQAHVAVAHDGLDPEPVPLDLVEPGRVVERLADER